MADEATAAPEAQAPDSPAALAEAAAADKVPEEAVPASPTSEAARSASVAMSAATSAEAKEAEADEVAAESSAAAAAAAETGEVATESTDDCSPTSSGVPPKVGTDRFVLQKRLGAGAFGQVWSSKDEKNNGRIVAVKLERKDMSKRSGQLVNEYELLHEFKTPVQQQGFAEVVYFGRQDEYVYLVMELLGKALDEYQAKCGGRFNVATTMYLGEQILRRLEFIHSRGILHRDVKPDNFMMGVGPNAHIVYMCDFGLSETYYDASGHFSHDPDSLTGTARYASINAHCNTQSRRDDVESLGYVLVYLLTGTLPWIGLDAPSDDDEYTAICQAKKSISPEKLCEKLPSQLAKYITYARKLAYKQRPDYTMLRQLCDQARRDVGSVSEWDLQWLNGAEFKEPLNPIVEWHALEQPDELQPGCSCFRMY
eukprot:TRINITY_DN11196_c0_g2_i1.p1 TRINITY_DN11196_c0_g2~~TRINITY_DN11196_c0_g2_i1.p1  ORF type:complete len:470 (+),score=102.67 TRINITY_DN11196_c0_g2_i1:135-1412(+)